MRVLIAVHAAEHFVAVVIIPGIGVEIICCVAFAGEYVGICIRYARAGYICRFKSDHRRIAAHNGERLRAVGLVPCVEVGHGDPTFCHGVQRGCVLLVDHIPLARLYDDEHYIFTVDGARIDIFAVDAAAHFAFPEIVIDLIAVDLIDVCSPGKSVADIHDKVAVSAELAEGLGGKFLFGIQLAFVVKDAQLVPIFRKDALRRGKTFYRERIEYACAAFGKYKRHEHYDHSVAGKRPLGNGVFASKHYKPGKRATEQQHGADNEPPVEEASVDDARHFRNEIEHAETEHHAAHGIQRLVCDRQHYLQDENERKNRKLGGRVRNDQYYERDYKNDRQIQAEIGRKDSQSHTHESKYFEQYGDNKITARKKGAPYKQSFHLFSYSRARGLPPP